jgi:hypothetical protein
MDVINITNNNNNLSLNIETHKWIWMMREDSWSVRLTDCVSQYDSMFGQKLNCTRFSSTTALPDSSTWSFFFFFFFWQCGLWNIHKDTMTVHCTHSRHTLTSILNRNNTFNHLCNGAGDSWCNIYLFFFKFMWWIGTSTPWTLSLNS